MPDVATPGGFPAEGDPGGSRYRARPSRAGRAGRVLLAVLSTAVLALSVGGYLVTNYFDHTIARLHLNLGGSTPAADSSSNWLLVGTDSRAGSGSQYGSVPGQRSDTTILAHLAKDGTTTLVSIPRDTYVEVPAYDANGVHHLAAKDKFTNAINVGGPSLLVATVEQLTGLPVEHYVSVDLAGFKQVTDAVGGVNVCLKQSSFSSNDQNDAGTATVHVSNTNDPFSGWHGGPGTLHLNGEQALAFVRQRHGLPEGDINRIERQQQFLGSVFRSATATRNLLDPGRVTSLLFSVRDALSLDQNTSSSDLEALAERLKGTAAAKLVFATLPVRELKASDPRVFSQGGLLQLPKVGSVVVYDQQALDAFLAPLRGHSPSPPPSTAPAPAPAPVVALAPAQVRVQVRNTTSRTGLAGQVSRGLEQLQFRSSVGADQSPQLAASQVRYAPADRQAAQTVAAAVPGSVLLEDRTQPPGTVVLALGTGYDKLQAVTVQGQTSTRTAPAPSPATSPSPPPVTAASAGNRCTL